MHEQSNYQHYNGGQGYPTSQGGYSGSQGSQQKSSTGNPNPISTIGFLWNMGYPPPPITMDGLKKLCENCVDNSTFVIPEKSKMILINEVKAKPFSRSQTVLFVIQQALHSSKLEKVSNALELSHALMLELKLDFARHINREFMSSMKNVINTTSYKERTLGGSLKKLEKWMVGSSSNGVATDPKVQTLQKRALQVVRIWVDLTVEYELECMAIHELYRKLSSRGFQFPPSDLVLPQMSSFMSGSSSMSSNQWNTGSLMSSRGGNYRTFGAMSGGSAPSLQHGYGSGNTYGGGLSSAPSIPAHNTNIYGGLNPPPPPPTLSGSAQSGEFSSEFRPVDDAQLVKLSKALDMYGSPTTNGAAKERCVNVFKKMLPRVNARIEQETDDSGSLNRQQEERLANIISLRDRIEAAIVQFEKGTGKHDDEFADLGLDEYNLNANPITNPNCPFEEVVSKDYYATSVSSTNTSPVPTAVGKNNSNEVLRRYSGFASVTSDDDLIGGGGGTNELHSNAYTTSNNATTTDAPPTKIVDPFSALDDVWSEEKGT